ncbi:MAG: restriction endonuclease [Planctomycetota bacterium]
MPVPDFQTLMLPLLRFAADDKAHTLREAVDAMAVEFRLTEAEKVSLLPSGRQTVLHNRTGWARTFLGKSCLLASPRRGVFLITERGKDVLRSAPVRIDMPYLERFEEYRAFRAIRRQREEATEQEPAAESESATPEETLEGAYEGLRANLEAEVLDRVKGCSPAFFERLVVALLVKMGYGGTLRDAGKAVGGSGDGGIDGIIKEDRLGLDVVYIQAKRWEATVGRPELQKFVGALQGQRARKGVFITTSDFSRDAVEYTKQIDCKIALIDGAELASLMIDHGVGVSPVETYEIKRIDSDYFVEE